MNNLIYNLQQEIYDNLCFYFIGCFVLTLMLIVIYGFIDWNIIRLGILIFGVSVFVLISLFLVTFDEYYILTNINNNEKAKLTKDELKQLISYTKKESEKFNLDDLKS